MYKIGTFSFPCGLKTLEKVKNQVEHMWEIKKKKIQGKIASVHKSGCISRWYDKESKTKTTIITYIFLYQSLKTIERAKTDPKFMQ